MPTRCPVLSGGPLYDKVNSVLVGVVSWGYGCADRDYPVST
jgi:secreted trypsin-like serine protease